MREVMQQAVELLQTGTVAEHNIKRVSRFVRNRRVSLAECCHGLVALAAKAPGRCLVVAVDRVDVGKWKVLEAAVSSRGRVAGARASGGCVRVPPALDRVGAP